MLISPAAAKNHVVNARMWRALQNPMLNLVIELLCPFYGNHCISK